jgi:hypothetical protein
LRAKYRRELGGKLAKAVEREGFEPLQSAVEFAKLRADSELDTIVWLHGADLAPGFLGAEGAARSAGEYVCPLSSREQQLSGAP